MLSDPFSRPPSMEVPGSVRIAIVDDHPNARDGFLRQFEQLPACTVVLVAEDGTDFIRKLDTTHKPHIVFVDMRMPRMNGPELMSWLREHHPDIKAIAVSYDNDDDVLLLAMRSGACGFHGKGDDLRDLERAIEHVLRTGYYHTDRLHALLVQYPGGITPEEREKERKLALITPREWDVLHLLDRLDAPTSDQVGALLNMSSRTVDAHIGNVAKKLGCSGRWAVMAQLRNWGCFKGPRK